MIDIYCKKCGSKLLHIEKKGTQSGLYCNNCGAWIKWLNKNEIRKFQYNEKENNDIEDDKIKQIYNYVKKQEDYYYGKVSSGDNAISDITMSSQAVSFQKVRYFIEQLLDQDGR